MTEPPTYRYRLDDADYLSAAIAHQRRLCSSPIVQAGKWIWFAMTAFLGFALVGKATGLGFARGPSIEVLALAFFLGLGLSYLFSPSCLANKLWIRHQLRSIPEAARSIEWGYDPEFLWCRTGLSSSTFRWELFRSIVECPDCFLFYQGKVFTLWVPSHGFPSAEAIARFSEVARGRVSQYVVLGRCRHPAKPGPVGLDEL